MLYSSCFDVHKTTNIGKVVSGKLIIYLIINLIAIIRLYIDQGKGKINSALAFDLHYIVINVI